MSSQLQNGEQQFLDDNGKPLDAGTVDFYIPNTTTRKDTWQDQALTILNTNPIVLDAGGRATIWGTGSYRQILKDKYGNLIWDKVVADSLASLPPVVSQAALASQVPTYGASLVGFDSNTVTDQFKNRVNRVVNTFNDIRGLSSAIYTRTYTTGALTAGDGGQGDYWMDPSDTTTADDGWNTLVASDNARWKRLRLIWQKTTSGSDNPTVQIARNTSHSGGTAGVVTNALNVSVVVGAGVTNFEWGFLSQLDNSATTGENVAVYGQAKKRAQGSTWAGCFEIQDIYTADPAVGSAIGVELACSGNGGDTGFQRNGVHVAMGKLLPGGATCEWGNGVRTTAGADSRFGRAFVNEGPFRLAAFANIGDSSGLINSATFLDTGKAARGLDLSGAIYTGSAIQLANNQILAFEATSAVKLYASGGLLVCPARISVGASIAVPSTGNVFNSAGAASGQYWEIYVDGVPKRIQLLAQS